MIPYGHQSINAEDIKQVVKVLKSNRLTQGPKILEFEKSLANYCGAKYAVIVSSGTAALHLAYLAAGIGKGDEVITSPNTFVATTNMLLAVGAKPVFGDIRPDTCNLDESKIEKLITAKTKAIVPVHFAGHPCEMDEIKRIAKKYRLLVIEDACHALGAEYKNKKIGSLSDMTVFSFHPVKTITTGEGGAILTNSRKYYAKMLKMRSHGTEKDRNGFNVMRNFGYNYRLTDIQASLGLSQFSRIEEFINKRRKIAEQYSEDLSEINQILLPVELETCRSSWHLFIIRVKNAKDRLPLYKHLLREGIGANLHYPCVYKHPYYQKIGYARLKRMRAELYANTAVTIPLHPALKEKELRFVADAVKDFFKNRRQDE